ncbi:MAG: nodulation protein NfeD [Nitrososphaerota archaeon]
MHRHMTYRTTLLIIALLASITVNSYISYSSYAQSRDIIIVRFDVPVDAGSSALMQRAVDSAIASNASAIVIDMNTPGGLLSDMLSIVNSIQKANSSGIPVYTYVPAGKLAASAGSYIAMASNKIIMGPGSVIGPSTPIVVGGTALEQNHTEAAMLKLMVGLAQDYNRNTTAAEQMVLYDTAYTAEEAYSYHIIEGIAPSLNDALLQLGISNQPSVNISENLYEQLLSALSNTTLDGILMLLGITAIVLDIYHPTVILTIIGIIAIVAGLVGAEVVSASILGFAILAVSAVLIILELKLGHGFAMMGGIILGAIGVLLLTYNMEYSPSPINDITSVIIAAVAVAGVAIGLYVRWILTPLRMRRAVTGPEAIIGQTGTAIDELNPLGTVRVSGIVWQAKSSSGSIHAGDEVKVLAREGLVLIVEKVKGK